MDISHLKKEKLTAKEEVQLVRIAAGKDGEKILGKDLYKKAMTIWRNRKG